MTEKRKGRPPFAPTLAQRSAVEQMRYCEESQAVIARAIGIDEDTLKKHFGDELADGHAKRRKEVVGMLFTSAKKGNVSAQKKLEEMGKVGAAAQALEDRATTGGPPAVAASTKVGKKEQQQQAAERISGKYAPPAAPRLVVSND